VLRRVRDGRHVLVTPVEKLDIEVETTAFRATGMRIDGEGRKQRIIFVLDSGDAVLLSARNPLRLEATSQGPSPRLLVRHGLEAELTRPVYYELAELAVGNGERGVWSDGHFFALEEK
jgi:hypothetical protein